MIACRIDKSVGHVLGEFPIIDGVFNDLIASHAVRNVNFAFTSLICGA